MEYLFTGLYTALLIASAVCAWRTRRHADRAESAARKLEHARGRLVSLESAFDSLERAHKKLSGRFYARRAETVDVEHIQHQEEQAARALNDSGAFGICNNWRIAQVEGPFSEAAACECDFCVQTRQARAQIRAEVRKTFPSHAATVVATKARS